jgi:hypothetical protein
VKLRQLGRTKLGLIWVGAKYHGRMLVTYIHSSPLLLGLVEPCFSCPEPRAPYSSKMTDTTNPSLHPQPRANHKFLGDQMALRTRFCTRKGRGKFTGVLLVLTVHVHSKKRRETFHKMGNKQHQIYHHTFSTQPPPALTNMAGGRMQWGKNIYIIIYIYIYIYEEGIA